jgi:hypothetical protein
MKIKTWVLGICAALLFIGIANFSLEARHHHTRFGINVGTTFVNPQPYVMAPQYYYEPVYVQRPAAVVYSSPVYSAPVPVYSAPVYQPVYQPVYVRPSPINVFSFGFGWRL